MKDKYLIITILMVILYTNANACLCQPFITSSFSMTESTIKQKLTQQKSALKQLKEEIKKANKEFKEQNENLNKENNLLKEEALRDAQLIFYLRTKNELK